MKRLLTSLRRALASPVPQDADLRAAEERFHALLESAITERRRAEERRAEEQRAELTRAEVARAEAEASHRGIAFLAEASTVLSASLDYTATLRSVARLAVPQLADWCAIDVVDDEGRIEQLAIAHLDPDKERFAEEWFRRHPIAPRARWGVPNVLRSGKSELWPELPASALTRAAKSPEDLAQLTALGLRSLMIVPLAARGRILGAITLVTAESGRRYSPSDLVLAEDLAHRAALAVDNARLYQEAEIARAHAEAASRRLRSLQAITETALAHLSVHELLRAVTREVQEAVAADAAVILLLDEQGEALVPPAPRSDTGEPSRPVPAGGGVAARILAERRPVLLEDVGPAETAQAGLGDARVRALVGVPLVVGEAPIGVLHVGAFQPGRFSADDIHLLQLAADRVALAVDRASVYQSERRARRDAEAANRMKDEFLATVSHELRTPLTAILGWARLLRSPRYQLPETAQGPLETIERNARAQAQLVDDLLDVSRIITGRLRLDLRPVDLASVIDAALDAVRPTAGAKGMVLECSIDPTATAVLGDPDRLQQVVWNLLTNAVKFTPEGGRVTLTLARDGRFGTIAVRDTGQGIGKEFLPHLFERFRQEDGAASRAHGGLGLGLAIVRHLVEMHGGHVHAESAGPGCGSVFTVTLPLTAASEFLNAPRMSRRDDADDRPDIELSGCRVLVVDDEPDSRVTVAAMLTAYGTETHAVASAEDALAVLREGRIDVLVADIGMPEIDGYELIRRVRVLPGELAQLPAIALTAYARADDRDRALRAGYDAHVAKPVEPSTLAEAVAGARMSHRS